MTRTQDRQYPAEQRSNLVRQLHLALQRKLEEDDLSFDQAYSRVALEILGYDTDLGTMSDGRGDCGIDFWIVEEHAATIFQFKSHDFTDKLDSQSLADPKSLTDLPRISAILSDLNDVPSEANGKVKDFIKTLRSAIDRFRLAPDANETPFEITIFFCCLAKAFTPQAQAEFDKLATEHKLQWGSQAIRMIAVPIFIDDLIAERWRESNTDWRTASGQRSDRIELHVCGGEMITAPKSAIFFTKAYDLVHAFDTFGYQMFEPNVRCELKRSKVNEAIRESIKHARGRKEFRHLNNGITLICASFNKVQRQNEPLIRVSQPGVINGLQTVKSIHDALDELDDKEKEHFRSECEILVRLHTRQAVHDYKELVKSTNNQNPMQPRNLRSNDPEQIYYESLFAELDWFYERKEGAWKAFQSDSSLWGSLRGKRVSNFKSSATGTARCIDNLEMSQAWLSLIGFSNDAIHFKRDIFSDERFYDVIFKKRVVKHGYDYNFSFSDPAVRAEALEQAPSPESLLLSQLLREIADNLTPSRKLNRDEAIRRLKIEKLKKEDQDAQLVLDPVYIRGLVQAGAKYLFVDFCGLIFFRALGVGLYDAATRVLKTRSMNPIFQDRNFEPFGEVITHSNFEIDDVVSVLWAVYNYCLDNIISQTGWRQQFEQAAVRSRFNYSDFNRKALFNELENLDAVYKKRPFPRPWSEGIEKHNGIFSYVQKTLLRRR